MIGIVLVGVRLHVNQVNDAVDCLLEANRQVNWQSILAQPMMNRVKRLKEVATGLVDLINEDHPGDIILVGLAPNRLGLRLNPHLTVQYTDCSVQHP